MTRWRVVGPLIVLGLLLAAGLLFLTPVRSKLPGAAYRARTPTPSSAGTSRTRT